MGVKKLQTYMETYSGPEGFRSVSIEELKAEYEKENPGAPVELLLDVECCLRFIYRGDFSEFRFGGENVTLLKLLRNFFDRFSSLGIKLISFYGNYTSKKKRSEWVRRRYDTIDKVGKIIHMTERNQFDNSDEDMFVIPPGLCFTSTSIIKFVLKEKVIQSLTENDIEIITYAKKNKSFAIMSQDSDFIIANAAKYYLSIKHLDLNTMTTQLYDGNVLAKIHNLKHNQMPLYASLLGTDLIDQQILQEFHNKYFFKRNEHRKIDLDYFFSQAAMQCKNVECDDNCVPVNKNDLIQIVRNIRGRKCNYNFDEVYGMILESIQSYNIYEVEDELYFSNMKDEKMKETLKFALLLYRQCWITSDLLMLLCSKTTEMSTCMEIFDYNVKPIGIVLGNLKATLYSATFNGDTRVRVEEFSITGKGCFDRSVPQVWVSRIPYVRPLLEVWQSSLEPDVSRPGDYEESFDPKLQLDNVVFKSKESERDKCKEYFVDIFCQCCHVSSSVKKTLVTKFKLGLPKAVHLPLFIFIYLESDRHAYLHESERDAVLFTFSTVSVLSLQQVEEFSHPKLKIERDMVPLMRAANLFRRAAQVMINLNAVCGFPIPVQWVDGHNFWQGSFIQRFHSFLYLGYKSQTDLYEVIIEALSRLDDTNLLPRFTNLMKVLSDLCLFEKELTARINTIHKTDGEMSQVKKTVDRILTSQMDTSEQNAIRTVDPSTSSNSKPTVSAIPSIEVVVPNITGSVLHKTDAESRQVKMTEGQMETTVEQNTSKRLTDIKDVESLLRTADSSINKEIEQKRSKVNMVVKQNVDNMIEFNTDVSETTENVPQAIGEPNTCSVNETIDNTIQTEADPANQSTNPKVQQGE